MANVPEGAQRSADGNWWWDGDKWQAVEQDGGAANGGAAGSGGQAEARVAQGLPAALHDLTDEHRAGHQGEPTVEVEALEAEEVEVLAMSDSGDGSGEAYA
jgi:hypothetical protein